MYEKREHCVVIAVLGRLFLVAMLLVNFTAASIVIGQWKAAPFNILLAAGIEGTLFIVTYLFADARTYNATRPRKTDPAKPAHVPFLAMLLFGALSGALNYEALALSGAGTAWAAVLGVPAPMAVGILAYVISQEAVTTQRLAAHEAERTRINQEKREARAQKRVHQQRADDQQVLALKAEVTALRAEVSEQREQARLLEASTEPAPSEHVCQYCNEWSGQTLQALRAHESWCEQNPDGRRTNHREPVAVEED